MIKIRKLLMVHFCQFLPCISPCDFCDWTLLILFKQENFILCASLLLFSMVTEDAYTFGLDNLSNIPKWMEYRVLQVGIPEISFMGLCLTSNSCFCCCSKQICGIIVVTTWLCKGDTRDHVVV